VLETVDISDRAHTDLNLDLNSKTTVNVLGIKWDFITDTLQMHIHFKSKPDTRGGLLSIISSVFDPLGMVAPVLRINLFYSSCAGKVLAGMKASRRSSSTSANVG